MTELPIRKPAPRHRGEGLSRRQTIAWMLAAASSPLALSGCERGADAAVWRDLGLPPITGPRYGTDPDLMEPSVPWPLTLTDNQRRIVRVAADVILPADGASPSAASLDVDAFIDEWVSAPYEPQQNDRELILSGLAWIDAEATARFGATFADATDAQRREIFDDIAHRDRVREGYDQPAEFFDRLRSLVMAGYYTSPEGTAELGYIGNTPIVGDYPGPTEEAMAHLREKLAELGLPEPD